MKSRGIGDELSPMQRKVINEKCIFCNKYISQHDDVANDYIYVRNRGSDIYAHKSCYEKECRERRA